MLEKSYASSEVQLVVFKLGKEEYSVSILQVQEIKRITDITRVPHTPDYIKGVINLRGSVLPVIDLKKRLNLPQQVLTEDTRIIIVKVDELSVGMIVDAVSEVMTIDQENIDSPDVVAGSVAASYLSGVGKLDNRLLILLNLEEIIGVGQETKVV
ncbi:MULTISPECIES: chemotaxis protein CheW [Pelosinus]|jgi:purine-binding chemotaxis protein CheW|uniref:Chemotaxis protein CheW n=3 Tax=Pelosinus TaxID=365348 RepID=I9DLJ8_9FIRM|nr:MULTISPECIES: chemotaxis protein CheW [Pelosinus]MBP2658310.1 CheW protein [Bacillota bacterium]AJQ27340.1 CheW protein [Pelosinus fermentans JBW45]EIW18190.1 CheW domain protein [Pelosinus fermentans B4]EIW23994.1 CheW protein [Pelosinus fermentans A11]MCC5464971.1 chemotaxis protein CheW [Pelosinus baikalensis]